MIADVAASESETSRDGWRRRCGPPRVESDSTLLGVHTNSRHRAELSGRDNGPSLPDMISHLVSNHFVEPACQVVAAERIVQLISDELKVRRST